MLSFIQLLRALAVIVVIVFHLNPKALPGGYLGVDIFFIISGFVITRSILQANERNDFDIKLFYIRRIWRLFPQLFFVIFTTALFCILLSPPAEFQSIFKAIPWALAQLSNIHFAKHGEYFDLGNDNNPLLHTWSLAVEEQFYIVFPFLILFLLTSKLTRSHARKIYLIGLLAGVSLFVHCLSSLWNLSEWGFYLFPSRSWQFFIGVATGLCWGDNKWILAKFKSTTCLSVISFFIILASFILIDKTITASNPAILLLPCVACGVLLLSCSDRWFSNPTWKPFLLIGDLSYSLYLWHWPVICFTRSFTGHSNFWWVEVMVFSVLALLSYYFLEQPLRRKGRKVYARPGPLNLIKAYGLAILMVLFIPISSLVSNIGVSSWRIIPDDVLIIQSDQKIRDKAFTKSKPGSLELSKHFSASTQVDFLLVGDSHAIAAYPAFSAACEDEGLSFHSFIASSFYPVAPRKLHFHKRDQGGIIVVDHTAYQMHLEASLLDNPYVRYVGIALRTNAYIGNSLPSDSYTHQSFISNSSRPEVAVMENRATYENDLVSFVRRLNKTGKKVIILSQVPPLDRVPNANSKPTRFGYWIYENFLPEAYTGTDPIPFVLDLNERLSFERSLLSRLSESNPDYVSVVNSCDFLHSSFQNAQCLYRDQDHINYYGAALLKNGIFSE